jgi:hypothetical protein
VHFAPTVITRAAIPNMATSEQKRLRQQRTMGVTFGAIPELLKLCFYTQLHRPAAKTRQRGFLPCPSLSSTLVHAFGPFVNTMQRSHYATDRFIDLCARVYRCCFCTASRHRKY